MTIDQICAIPVAAVCAQDAACFMWATMPMIPDALRVLREWGFTYKTVAFTWVKTNRKAWTPFFGMGNWTRANAEIVLLGIRGRPKRVAADVPQIVIDRIMRHSEKPDEVRLRIVRLMGDVPRLEMFSRHRVAGWKRWGNQVLQT